MDAPVISGSAGLPEDCQERALHQGLRLLWPLLLVCQTVFPPRCAAAMPYEAGGHTPLVAPRPNQRIERLAAAVDSLISGHRGRVAVAIVHLTTGESIERQADEPMPTASLIKVAVLIEAYRQAEAGVISLEELVELRQDDKVPGSGILTTHFSPGLRLPLRDALRLMIAFSDNTATNLVLNRTGLQSVNDTMAALDCPHTAINSLVFRGSTSIAPERSRTFGLGSTTANEMVSLLRRLHAQALVTPAASREMLAHLSACDDRLKFPRLLPSGTKLAHKTGSVNRVRTDAGLLQTSSGTIALCVLTADNEDTSWTEQNAGDLICSEIAKAAYEIFSERPSQTAMAASRIPSSPGPLSRGASGAKVAELQHQLNVAMPDHAPLAVDGEFGSFTEAALREFQKMHGLSVTGRATEETLRALKDETVSPHGSKSPPVAN